jgi:type II secretory pathway component PulF
MKEFRYRALTSAGEVVAGVRHAPDAATLTGEMLAQNLVILEARPTLGSLGRLLSSTGRVSRRDLRDFTLHLATCLGAGIPIITALRDFERESARGGFRDVIVDIRQEVAGGTQLSTALSHHPEVFSEIYLAMVKAGEAGGGLDEMFGELVAYLEWIDDLHAKSKQAMIYPAILLTGVIGLFMLLLLYVIPRFMGIFNSVDFELPTITQRVLSVWHFFRHWWPVVVGGILCVVVGASLVRRTPRGRYLGDLLLLRLPVVGGFVHKLALSRFARHFALLFGSGTDLLRLLELLQQVVGNAVLHRELVAIRERVVTGETLADSFAPSPWFPPLIQRLISVGEKAGALDTSLLKAADYLDKELPRTLQQAFKVFEALVIAIMGALIVVSALALLMPILEIRSQLGR